MFTRAHQKSVFCQMYAVHIIPLCFTKIHSNIILPSTSRSSEWSLPFRFSYQNVVCLSHLFRVCYMLCPPRSPLFDHPNNILRSVHVMELLIMQFSPAYRHFLFGPYILFSPLFSNSLNLCFSLCVRDQVSRPYKTTGRAMISCILIFTFLERRQTNDSK
jgi:D-alanyl-lipoteichoic acid acyltransferase DltB (MBOAT superfamily)